MDPLNEARCRRILEVSSEASMEDISHEYHRLKRIYGEEDTTFDTLSMDEFSPATRRKILEEIEAAYKEICKLQVEAPPLVPAQLPHDLDQAVPFDGTALRNAREASGLSLERVVAETNVRLDFLRALEEERFHDLPSAPVYVRGYLTAYLSAIGQTNDQMIADYMARHRQWQVRRGK